MPDKTDDNNNGLTVLPSINDRKPSNTQVEMKKMEKMLTKQEIKAFRLLFDELDLAKSGSISVEELSDYLRKINKGALSNGDKQRIKIILKELDVNGTGDIDFEEFVIFLTRPEHTMKMLLDEDYSQIKNKIKGKGTAKDQNESDRFSLLYGLIKKTQKDSRFQAIREYYKSRAVENDHVIKDWSHGQRCIGLTLSDMLRRYQNIKKTFQEDKDLQRERKSPYASPLRWGIRELNHDLKMKAKLPKIQVKGRKKQKRNIPGKLVAPRNPFLQLKPLPKYTCDVKKTDANSRKASAKRPKSEKANLAQHKPMFTYDDLPRIRKECGNISSCYYSSLQQMSLSHKKSFLKRLEDEKIRSNHYGTEMSNDRFKQCYNSYTREPSVISPWLNVLVSHNKY